MGLGVNDGGRSRKSDRRKRLSDASNPCLCTLGVVTRVVLLVTLIRVPLVRHSTTNIG